MREVCIILQAPSASKPKYARAMLRQLHIFDTDASTPQLQEAYLANSFVNPRGLPHTFYEIDLLLEHQNGEFKRFRTDRGSSLQETDQMFRQHALSVDALRKVRLGMNKIIVGRDRTGQYIGQISWDVKVVWLTKHISGRHPPKDASFDILSLADQLYQSRSTKPEGPEPGKIYFSENPGPDLLAQGEEALIKNVKAYNESFDRPGGFGQVSEDLSTEEKAQAMQAVTFHELEGTNERVNEIFTQARESEFAALDWKQSINNRI